MNDTTPASLGAYLGDARRAVEGLTQEKLAGRLGVSIATVRQWEQNLRTPGPVAMHRLAQELPTLDPQRMLALAASAAPTGPR